MVSQRWNKTLGYCEIFYNGNTLIGIRDYNNDSLKIKESYNQRKYKSLHNEQITLNQSL